MTELDINENKLFEQCDRLSADKKALLVKHLLGDRSIQMVIGDRANATSLGQKIDILTREQIAAALKALADDIKNKS